MIVRSVPLWAGVLAVVWASGLCVLAAAIFAQSHVVRSTDAGGGHWLVDELVRWDGRSYVSIVSEGYRYDDAHKQGRIAFFPAYPLLGLAVHAVTRLSIPVSLLAVSWASFPAAMWLLGRYPLRDGTPAGLWAVAAAACVPAGFFFRMGYTESTCLLLLVGTLAVVRAGGPPVVAAVLAGLASGTRSVGIAALPVVLIYAVRRQPTWRAGIGRAVLLTPVAAWGVLAFSAYQGVKYHDPLAFVKVQDTYRMRPRVSGWTRAVKLATLEPIWGAYTTTSDAAWGHMAMSGDIPEAAFNPYFWNPIYLVGAAGLVVLGGVKRWLGRYELVLAGGLLLIPYVTRGYDFGVGSQARFTVVCFPVYLVLGRLLAALPEVWRTSLVVLASLQMCAWAALFAAGYPIF